MSRTRATVPAGQPRRVQSCMEANVGRNGAGLYRITAKEPSARGRAQISRLSLVGP